MTERELEKYVRSYIDNDGTFEDLLEQFNLTPEETFTLLVQEGMIDLELLEDLRLTNV